MKVNDLLKEAYKSVNQQQKEKKSTAAKAREKAVSAQYKQAAKKQQAEQARQKKLQSYYTPDRTESNARAAQKRDREYIDAARKFLKEGVNPSTANGGSPATRGAKTQMRSMTGEAPKASVGRGGYSLAEYQRLKNRMDSLTPGEVQAFLDEDTRRKKELKKNSNKYDYGNWIDEISAIDERKGLYKKWLDGYRYTGKSATGDEDLDDNAYHFKMQNLTPEEASGYIKRYTEAAKDKSLPYSERARYRQIADNYRRIYRDKKYDSLVYRPDFEILSKYDGFGDTTDYEINHSSVSEKRNMADAENRYRNMSDKERGIYNYLYKTQGKKAARDYIKEIEPELRERNAKEEIKWAEGAARKHPLATTVIKSLAAPTAGLESIGGNIKSLLSGDIDENSNAYRTTLARQAINRTINNDVLSNEGERIIYNAVSGMLDNLVQMVVGGTVTGAVGSGLGMSEAAVQKLTANVVSGLMSSEAAATSMIEEKQKGTSNRKAVAMGLIMGGIEYLTEKWSIENILKDPTNAKQALIKSFIAEGSEEWTGNQAERIVDLLINRDANEISKKYREYRNKGLGEKGAFKEVIWDIVKEDAETFLIGGLSGFGIAGGAYLSGNMAVRAADIEEGRKYTSRDMKNLAKETLEDFADNTESVKKARKIQEKFKNGKTPSAREIGALVRENDRVMAEERAKEGIERKSPDKIEVEDIVEALANNGVENPADVALDIINFKNGADATERMGDINAREVIERLAAKGYFRTEAEETAADNKEQRRPSENQMKVSAESRIRSFGENGARAYEIAFENEIDDGYEGSEYAFLYDYSRYYTAALKGMSLKDADERFSSAAISQQAKEAAFSAGLADREENLRTAREQSRQERTGEGKVNYNGFETDDDTKGIIEGIAKRTGTDIEIVNLSDEGEMNPLAAGGANGYYYNGKIVLSAEALNSSKSRNEALRFLVGHEATHRIQALAPKDYMKFRDIAMRDADTETIGNEAAKRGITLDEAIDELLADQVGRSGFAERIAREDISLAEKIRNIIRDILDAIGRRFEKRLGNLQYSEQERILRTWDKAIDKAKRQAEKNSPLSHAGRDSSPTGRAEGKVKYSEGGITPEDVKTIQDIAKNYDKDRVSINDLTSEDIKKLEYIAQKYYKEMGVKSPFFRAWFGDWRANDETPLHIVSEKGSTRRTVKNSDTGWNINVSGKVFNENKTHKSSSVKMAAPYLDYINSIVENAVLLDSHVISDAKSINSIMMHSLYTIADIGNGKEVLKLFVEELNDVNSDGTIKRAYQLENIKSIPVVGARVQKNLSPVTKTTGSIKIISDLFEFVKQNDKNFSPREASKVVDKDKMPKVMYRGDNEDISIFDRKKSKPSNLYGRGFYFTDSESHAGEYGEPKAYYLNIVDPLSPGQNNITREQMRSFLEAVADNEDDYDIWNYGTTDIDEVLESVWGKGDFEMLQDVSATAIGDLVEATELFNRVNGTHYDGFILPTETVVFDSTQIKSATDNIGTFDKNNPHVKHSKGDIDELMSNGYEQAQKMQSEERELTKKIREMEEGNDFKELMDLFRYGSEQENVDKAIEEYQKWKKETGYDETVKKRDELRDKLDRLKKDLDEAYKQKEADTEKKAIQKSGLDEKEYFQKQAVKEFGYTPYFYDAGYITENGKMLNFSGEKGKHFGSRGDDHRAIGIIYANTEGSDAMIRFMNDGNIRVMAESPGIDISSSVEPTSKQYATIRQFVREYAKDGYFNVDLTDAKGNTIGNYEYTGQISAERVVNDIKYFFEHGETREGSSVSQFHYSKGNIDELMKGLNDDSELGIKDQIRKYSSEINKMEPVFDDSVNIVNRGKTKNKEWILPMFEKLNYEVIRDDIGRIVIDKTRVSKSLSYLKSDGELAAYSALPEVLKNGKIFGGHINHKNRMYDTVTVMARVKINGIPGNMGAAVRLDKSENYYKVHRILMPNGKMFEYENNNAETEDRNHINETGTSPTDIVINDILSQDEGGVKRSEKKSVGDIDELLKGPYEKHEEEMRKKFLRELGFMDNIAAPRVPNNKHILNAAKKVAEGYNGEKNIPKQLTEAYKKMWDYFDVMSDKKATTAEMNKAWENFDSVTESIAGDIIHNTLIREDESYRQFKDIRKRIRAEKIFIPKSARSDIDGVGGYNEFRKANLGKFILSEGGRPIDDLWQEMNTEYGELFPEDITHPADQIKYIADLIDRYEVTYENPYDADFTSALMYKKTEIFDILSTEVLNEGTVEEVNKNIKDLRRRTAEDLKRIRDTKDAEIERLKKKAKTNQKKRIARKAERSMREQLLTLGRRVEKLKKSKGASQEIRDRIDELLKDIDLVSVSLTQKSINKLSDLAQSYEEFKKSENFRADQKTEDAIKRLGMKHIKDLTLDDVSELIDSLKNIEHEIRTKDRLIQSHDRREISIQSTYIINDILNSKGLSKSKWNPRTAIDGFTTGILSPLREIHRITGYFEGDPLYNAAKELQKGEAQAILYEMRANKRFEKWTGNEKFIKSIRGKKSFKSFEVEQITKDGIYIGKKTIRLNPDMVIALYLHSKNDQNLKHAGVGGVTVADEKLYNEGKLKKAYAEGERVYLAPAEIRKICASLTEEQREYANAISDYFDYMATAELNRVSNLLLGYDIATVKHYFPIKSDPHFLKKDAEALQFDGTIEGMGFLKERVDSGNPMLLEGASEVLANAIKQHAKYSGLAIPIRDFNQLIKASAPEFVNGMIHEEDEWGNKLKNKDGTPKMTETTAVLPYGRSVREVIEKKWNERATEYIDHMLADLQNGRKEKAGGLGRALSFLSGQKIKSVLGLNIPVAVNQAASYTSAIPVLGYRATLRALAEPGRADLKQVEKRSGLLWHRTRGEFDPTVADTIKRGNKFDEIMAKPAFNFMADTDTLVTRKLWKATVWSVKYDIKKSGEKIEIGSDEFWDRVNEKFEDMMMNTQPNTTPMERPAFLRADNETKHLLPFTGEPLKNVNLTYDAVFNYTAKIRQYRQLKAKPGTDPKLVEFAKKDMENAAKNARVTVVSQLLTTIVYEVAVTAARLLVGSKAARRKYEDEEGNLTLKSVGIRMAKDAGINFITQIPFTSDIIEITGSVIKLIKALKDGENITASKQRGSELLYASVLSNAIDGVIGLGAACIKTATGEITPREAVFQIADGTKLLSEIGGVPLGNVFNMVGGIYDNTMRIVHRNDPEMREYARLMWDKAYVTAKKNDEGETVKRATAAIYDILYRTYAKGNKETYNTIVKDLMDQGVKPSEIESAIESRKKKDTSYDPERSLGAYAGTREAIEYQKYEGYIDAAEKKGINVKVLEEGVDIAFSGKKYKQMAGDMERFINENGLNEEQAEYFRDMAEKQYKVNELNAEQYLIYSQEREDIGRKIDKELDYEGAEDNKSKDKISTYALEYTEKNALRRASGGDFVIKSKWVNKADEFEKKGYMSAGEFINRYEKYGSAVYSDNAVKMMEKGKDIDTYLEFNKRTSNISGFDLNDDGKNDSYTVMARKLYELERLGVSDDKIWLESAQITDKNIGEVRKVMRQMEEKGAFK